MTNAERIQRLLRLSHALGDPQRPLAILGEGNTSTRLGDETFLVKVSGANLATLREDDVVECRFDGLLSLLDRPGLSDKQVDAALMDSRANKQGRKPSVEALFHAFFLSLPDIEFVGHTHAPAVNGVLCSVRAQEFAAKRLFPDEVVCCDVESVFVSYTDPGLKLAQEIRRQTNRFVKKHGRLPRVVLMENHGIITLGLTIEAVLAAMWMSEKAAQIWIGAAAVGGPKFMTRQHVSRIAGRPDEEVRRKVLGM